MPAQNGLHSDRLCPAKTRVEVSGSDKHASLAQSDIDYGCIEF